MPYDIGQETVSHISLTMGGIATGWLELGPGRRIRGAWEKRRIPSDKPLEGRWARGRSRASGVMLPDSERRAKAVAGGEPRPWLGARGQA